MTADGAHRPPLQIKALAKKKNKVHSYLNLLFSFEGRVERGVWWASLLVFFVVLEVFVQCGLLIFPHNAEGINRLSILYWLFCLLCSWPMLAIEIKRWHDRGKS